jgi:hypothetical protein
MIPPHQRSIHIFVYRSLSFTTSSCGKKKLLLSALQQYFGADLLLQQFLSGGESSNLDLAITMSAAFSKLCPWKLRKRSELLQDLKISSSQHEKEAVPPQRRSLTHSLTHSHHVKLSGRQSASDQKPNVAGKTKSPGFETVELLATSVNVALLISAQRRRPGATAGNSCSLCK